MFGVLSQDPLETQIPPGRQATCLEMTSKHFTGIKFTSLDTVKSGNYGAEYVSKLGRNIEGKVFNAFTVLTIGKVEQRAQER